MHEGISRIAAAAAFAIVLASAGEAQTAGTGALNLAVDRVRANPANPEASFQLAAVAINQGNVPTAISALERVLMVNPQLDNIRLELGLLYLRSGSTDLAESYIAQAMTASDIPDEVRARGAALLAEAQGSKERTRVSVTTRAGFRFDSNATSAPAAGVFDTPFGVVELEAEDAGASDFSASFGATARVTHDLGFQAGHLLVFEAGYSGQRFNAQAQLNLDRVDLSVGPTLMLGRALDRPAELSIRAFGGYQLRAGEAYLGEYGLRGALAVAATPETQVSLGAGLAYQDYLDTTDLTDNDRKDGLYANGTLGVQYRFDDSTMFRGDLMVARKEAREDLEAFTLMRAGVGVVRALPQMGGVEPILSLDAAVESRSYDGTALVATTVLDREDLAYEFGLGLEIPLKSGPAVLGQFSYRTNDSNDDLNDYDNIGLQIGIAHRF
ncbi:MAG: tetratricopeptide repeat protein [Maritimibacter sp.]|nr:tetratricopeptide repeat protein [Maritimibacter sp.]